MTVVERRQREKKMRRENAIIVASKLFYSKGYESVSMDEIAKEAELGKTTLYKYFIDKQALFIEVVKRGTEILSSIIREEEERAQTTCNRFGVLDIASKRFSFEYPEYAYSYIIFRSGRYGIFNNTDMKNEIEEINKFTKELFEEVISEINLGIENGIIRSEMNPIVILTLNILIHESTLNMSPDLKHLLNAHGIDIQEFYTEAHNLFQHVYRINEEKLEDPFPCSFMD
jgi:TetR/AcrR family transcriptional regulator